jgi:Trypsin
MRSKHCRASFLLALAATMLLLTPTVVRAIVYGFVDQKNVFSNAGAFIVESPTG